LSAAGAGGGGGLTAPGNGASPTLAIFPTAALTLEPPRPGIFATLCRIADGADVTRVAKAKQTVTVPRTARRMAKIRFCRQADEKRRPDRSWRIIVRTRCDARAAQSTASTRRDGLAGCRARASPRPSRLGVQSVAQEALENMWAPRAREPTASPLTYIFIKTPHRDPGVIEQDASYCSISHTETFAPEGLTSGSHRRLPLAGGAVPAVVGEEAPLAIGPSRSVPLDQSLSIGPVRSKPLDGDKKPAATAGQESRRSDWPSATSRGCPQTALCVRRRINSV
jgi:hypothetical protein